MSRFVSSLRSSLNERGLSDRALRDRLHERGNPSSLQEGGTPSRSLSERSETKRASRQRGTN
ncbi:hypothetical protein J3D45_000423 [Microbacterium foliorum]|nr:hypothetical protein [Microbacterium foliorum]